MKRNEKEYPGIHDFDSRPRQPLKSNETLVAVWFDGEPDWYICEGQQAIINLEQMYRDEWQDTYDSHVDFIQIFKETASKYTSPAAATALAGS